MLDQLDRHVMVDLETLSTAPTAAILSIGATAFQVNPLPRLVGKSNRVNVDLQSCLDAGLTVDGPTFYWWMQQGETARQSLMTNQVHLRDALVLLGSWINVPGSNSLPYVWAMPAAFDLPILESACRAVGLPVPWHHRNKMCGKTILALARDRLPAEVVDGMWEQAEGLAVALFPEGAHDAGYDAAAQASFMGRLLYAMQGT